MAEGGVWRTDGAILTGWAVDERQEEISNGLPALARFQETLLGVLREMDYGGGVDISGLSATVGPLPRMHNVLGVRITDGSPPALARYYPGISVGYLYPLIGAQNVPCLLPKGGQDYFMPS